MPLSLPVPMRARFRPRAMVLVLVLVLVLVFVVLVVGTLVRATVLGTARSSPTRAAPPPPARRPGDALEPNTVVTKGIDGDTIAVALIDDLGRDEHVRLIGIDTPETKKPDTPVECFGPEASARLHDLLPDGTTIRLERDAEARDRYGRLLAYVYRASDGLFVNQAMVVDGFANTLTIAPNTAHAAELAAALDDARRQRRGLWAACSGPHAARPP